MYVTSIVLNRIENKTNLTYVLLDRVNAILLGTCTDHINIYTCECPDTYVGINCELYVCDDPDMQCLNNGTCVFENNGTMGCECPQAFVGERCNIDACEVRGQVVPATK